MNIKLNQSEKEEIEDGIDKCLQPIVKSAQGIFDRIRNDYCSQNKVGPEKISKDLEFIMKFVSLEVAKIYQGMDNFKSSISSKVYGNTMDNR